MNTSIGTLCKYQGHLVEITEETAVHTRRIRFVGQDMHGESCLIGADQLSPVSLSEFREYVRNARNRIDNQVIQFLADVPAESLIPIGSPNSEWREVQRTRKI